MGDRQEFFDYINQGYATKGEAIVLGAAKLDGETITNALVKVPLKTMNRHGLIAGATGTGKTKSLQVLAENLSDQGIPVLLMDMKGDLSGIAMPSPGHPKIDERHAQIGIPFEPKKFPVEILSLSEQEGVRLRATVSEFGPVLISRILDLSEAQGGVLAILFKYCDDNKLPLLDLNDLKKIVQYASNEGKDDIQQDYGRISPATSGAIIRKIVELEQQGGDLFFGERSFDTDDLLRIDSDGRGYINIVRLTDIQDRPKLFSTFMLCLLAEIYSSFPEQGDSDRPELVIFIDEAHLIFKEASDALLDQIESIVKLIRSKGVGIYFVTQNTTDVQDAFFIQLVLKIQHALRAFTAKDRKAIKMTAENYPLSDYYTTDEELTSLGIGEALVTALNEKGVPTPLAVTLMRAPMSRMDVLEDHELKQLLRSSQLIPKYNESIDRESAYEILNEKIEKAHEEELREKAKKEREATSRSSRSSRSRSSRSTKSALEKVLTSPTVIRSVLGILTKMIK